VGKDKGKLIYIAIFRSTSHLRRSGNNAAIIVKISCTLQCQVPRRTTYCMFAVYYPLQCPVALLPTGQYKHCHPTAQSTQPSAFAACVLPETHLHYTLNTDCCSSLLKTYCNVSTQDSTFISNVVTNTLPVKTTVIVLASNNNVEQMITHLVVPLNHKCWQTPNFLLVPMYSMQRQLFISCCRDMHKCLYSKSSQYSVQCIANLIIVVVYC